MRKCFNQIIAPLIALLLLSHGIALLAQDTEQLPTPPASDVTTPATPQTVVDPKSDPEQPPDEIKKKGQNKTAVGKRTKKGKKSKSPRKKKPVAKTHNIRGVVQADDFTAVKHACFYDDAGKEVECSKVDLLKEGEDKYSITKYMPKDKPLKRNVKPTEKGARRNKNPRRILAFYNPSFISHIQYNQLGYAATDRSQAQQSLWKVRDRSTQSLNSFGAQVGIPWKSFSVISGFRYRMKEVLRNDSTYDEPTIDSINDNIRQYDVYAHIIHETTSMGVWFDFEFYRLHLNNELSAFLTSGLDFDHSTLKFASLRMDDRGELPTQTLTSADSSFATISLRTGLGIDYTVFSTLGVHTGLTVIVPILETGRVFTGTYDDPNASSVKKEAGKDLYEQLDHRNSSFGLEMILGIGYGF